MKGCPSCATELPDDARFCGACGHHFESRPEGGAAGSSSGATPPDGGAAPAPSDAFTLEPADFARAFERVATEAEIALPAELPSDHASMKEAARAAGLDPKAVEKALHRVSIEKIPEEQRRAMGIVLEQDVEPAGRSPWVPIVVVVNLLAVVVVAAVLLVRDDAPARPAVELAPQQGEIDEAVLAEALDAFAAEAKGCYDEALQEAPELEGEIVLTLRIDLEGAVAEPRVSRESLGDDEAVACIVAAAKEQAYPAAKVAPVDVDVPLTFAPGS